MPGPDGQSNLTIGTLGAAIGAVVPLVGAVFWVGSLSEKVEGQSWPRKTGQSVKWIFCLTAA
jgi:hypothetical protein